jgi:predicted ATPase/DNA-binding CsgD family transcriptional regulator
MPDSGVEQRRSPGLPIQPTPLIGRERTLESLSRQLLRPEVRLLTLTGPAGTGKTRLASELAARHVGDFDGGCTFVDLVPVADPELVMAAIASALGVTETAGAVMTQVQHALAGRNMLLILDNIEHVIGAAPAIAELLGACPELTVLATSREPLRLRWERVYPVPPLGTPDLHHPPAPDVLAGYPSIELFVLRAQAVQPDFELTPDNASSVAEICTRLDGLPLAIELAAARAGIFRPQAMLHHLRELDLFSGGARDLPARHRTLRAAIAWSYDLLSTEERSLLRRLSVLVGGCTLESASIVGGPFGGQLSVLDGVVSLVEKSLLHQQSSEGEPRFRMLEMVRQFCLEQLAGDNELQAANDHLTEFCLGLAERAESFLVGPQQGHWLAKLDQEYDNLRAALHWTLEARQFSTGLRLASALWRFWYTRGLLTEGAFWLSELLRGTGDALGLEVRARALNAAGNLAIAQADYSRAAQLHHEAQRLHQQLDDRVGVARSLNNLGLVAQLQGDYAAASGLHEQALALRRELGDQGNIIYTLNNLGLVARDRSDQAAAHDYYEQALMLARELGDRSGEAILLNNLGELAHDAGELGRARVLYEQSLALKRELGDRRGMATSLLNIGKVLRDQGEPLEAAARCRESLVQVWELGLRLDLPGCLEALAGVAALQGAPARAARLLGAAEALRETVKTVRPQTEQPAFTRTVARVRTLLGPTGFAVAWGQGQALPVPRIVEEALTIEVEAVQPVPVARSCEAPLDHEVALLSQRERQVASLLARGLTNRQVAEELIIGERTVDSHVGNILSKLGLSSRVQIAAWAVDRKLASPRSM